jgi:hypothetical protein
VRLSRPRLILRASLLVLVGAFMAWRGFETRATAGQPGVDPSAAVALSRIALVEWILAGLAMVTAAAALLSLRQKPRQHSLHLGEGGTPPDGRAGGPGRSGR